MAADQNCSRNAAIAQRNRSASALWLALTLGGARLVSAAILGINLPALPITSERIDKLPANAQPGWKEYLKRSERQLLTDQTFFFSEMKAHAVKETIVPPEGRSGSRLPLRKAREWYGQTEALRIADI